MRARHFGHQGPAGCNHCGGIVSESLVQLLATEGINIPASVVQHGIEAYDLHTDVGSVRIRTPLLEKRIAAVYRGAGPSGVDQVNWESFDQFLLNLAKSKGASVVHRMVTDIEWKDGLPHLESMDGSIRGYDLAVVATGVNSHLLDRIEAQKLGYTRPETTTAFVCEFYLGQETVQKQFGDAMHVFLLDLPKFEFAALIPKHNCVTLCLLGEEIDNALVESFLNAPEVKQRFPLETGVPRNVCHCFPRINIQGSDQPFANRLLVIGDSGVTRLFKDGIGAAYRTAKAAATSVVLGGIAEEDFRRHYLPACQAIGMDNSIGKVVFFASGLMQRMRFSRRAMVRMTANEQARDHVRPNMSTVLWDVFSGSAPYKEVFLRTLHPSFIFHLAWNIFLALLSPLKRQQSSVSSTS